MSNSVGLLVTLEAKPEKSGELADFLQSARNLVVAEPDTSTWYAFQISADRFGIYDTFPGEDGRRAHLAGSVARALGTKAGELLATPPVIQPVAVLASK
ncbi:putative quinol monooxygenase [Arthrobacter sp. NyZ413]|uniref:putative quinol monooxygenase n=1 Tax=Arthrobacter sp. NyZ413 TaxID=3144669 RepID=UPI003BF7D3F0